MRLPSRITRLEAANRPDRHWHRVIVPVGATLDDALEEYGRERISATDGVIVRLIVDETRLEAAR